MTKARPFEQLVPKQRRDVNATWQIGEGSKRPNAQHKPPALGDVELIKTGDGSYTVKRDGETVASGVAFADITAVIRGERDVDELAAGKNGGMNDV